MSEHVSRSLYRAGWFDLANRVAGILPRPVLNRLGKSAGYLYARTHLTNVQIVRENLQLLGNETPPPSATAVYQAFGEVLADYFYAGSRSFETACGLVEDRIGFANLKAACDAGRGVLLLTPHLSFFELGGVVMKDLGYPMVALTQPEPSAALTEWRAAFRKRWGMETLEIGSDPFVFGQVIQELVQGKVVAALFDRPHPTQSYAARVPGGELACSSGVLLLALMAKCPVLPVSVVRKPNGRYRLDALEPFYIERRGNTATTLSHYTQHLVDLLWPIISGHPEQWFQFAPLQNKR